MSKMIYRSDDLSYASAEDIQKIKSLGLKTIIDLRTPNERRFKPVILNGSTARIINIPVFFGADLSRQEYFRYILRDTRSVDLEAMLKDIYGRFAFERTAAVKEIFETLAVTENYPLLIHCTAGKDRTGFISAVIQLACGADYNNVIKDYLETNTFIEGRIKKTAFFIRVVSLFRITKAQMKPMFMVKAENLENVLKKIFEQCGSIDGYLVGVCGINPDTLSRLRQTVLV